MLLHQVNLIGAKEPFNMFSIKPPVAVHKKRGIDICMSVYNHECTIIGGHKLNARRRRQVFKQQNVSTQSWYTCIVSPYFIWWL